MAIKRKELSIETLRGVAILFMVGGHVIGPMYRVGLHVYDDSAWRYFYYMFEYLRMPLFTVISGYVYALNPLTRAGINKFARGKIRRIILPFLTVSTLQYTISSLVPNTNEQLELSNIYTIYIFRYAQFWFLQAIALVFVTIGFLEYFQLLKTFKSTVVCGIIAVFISVSLDSLNLQLQFFSIREYFYLLPFFIFGVAINRYSHMLSHRPVVVITLIIFLICFSLQQYFWFSGVRLSKQSLLGVITGLSGIFLLFLFRKPNSLLARLGQYSYGIFLFHMFGTAGSRIIANLLGVNNKMVLFILGLSIGILLPIIVESRILEKKFILRHLLLGMK